MSFLHRNPLESQLINSIKNDDIDSFQVLVDSFFNINYKFSMFSLLLDEYLRFSPCLLAVSAYYKATNILRYLLMNGADLTIKDKRNMSIAHFAVYSGDFEILHLLDEYQVSFEGTLFTAAERGFEDIFKWLLYYKSEDLHQKRKDGSTLIDASSKSGNWKLTSFILNSLKNDLSICDALHLLQLVREANMNDEDDEYEEEEEEENVDDKEDNDQISTQNCNCESEEEENTENENKDIWSEFDDESESKCSKINEEDERESCISEEEESDSETEDEESKSTSKEDEESESKDTSKEDEESESAKEEDEESESKDTSKEDEESENKSKKEEDLSEEESSDAESD